MRRVLVVVLFLFVPEPSFAQGYCGNVTYPWQGFYPDGKNATFGTNATVVVPPGPEGIYPVDVHYPAPHEPQPTRFSLMWWSHLWPQGVIGQPETWIESKTMQMVAFVEDVRTERHPDIVHEALAVHPEFNKKGDVEYHNGNLSVPFGPGMHYVVKVLNSTPEPQTMTMILWAQVCFADPAHLAAFKKAQQKPSPGAPR